MCARSFEHWNAGSWGCVHLFGICYSDYLNLTAGALSHDPRLQPSLPHCSLMSSYSHCVEANFLQDHNDTITLYIYLYLATSWWDWHLWFNSGLGVVTLRHFHHQLPSRKLVGALIIHLLVIARALSILTNLGLWCFRVGAVFMLELHVFWKTLVLELL